MDQRKKNKAQGSKKGPYHAKSGKREKPGGGDAEKRNLFKAPYREETVWLSEPDTRHQKRKKRTKSRRTNKKSLLLKCGGKRQL